ncbi:DUF3617 family protein [Bradyrhizobium sp.]|uniref:DUF3617 domain-containing protein n=1 Tax=Bradyrhizobium sp. TaxID=376 RepID=UPI002609AB65|nr:DUF3617 family protein [Bradyrhizobium sp.]
MRSGQRRSPGTGNSSAAFCIGAVVSLLFVVQAAADDAPARKAGLWEIKTTIGGHAVTVKQCIDAATDRMLQSSTGPLSAQACPSRQVSKSDSGFTIESRCSFNGKPASARAVVTGSFDSAYTMTVTAEGKDLPAARMTMEGKWLGACAADQKPGDVIMSNGVKVNVPDLQKRALAPDAATQSDK